MRDHNELRPGQKFLQDGDKSLDVRLVQGRIDLVEHAKRARPVLKNCQQQGYAGQSFFAAAQERDVSRLLAGGASDDFDAAVEYVDPFFEHHVGLPAAKQLAKQRLEVLLYDL